MKISFAAVDLSKANSIAVAVSESGKLSGVTAKLDGETNGLVRKTSAQGRFKGKKGQFSSFVAPQHWDRVVLFGLGEVKALTVRDLQNVGGALVSRANRMGIKEISVAVESWPGCKLSDAEIAAQIAYGARLGSYNFDKYHTTLEEDKKPCLTSLTIMVEDNKGAKSAFTALEKIADGVFVTRDLVTEPANIMNPDTMAEECNKLKKLGVDVEIFGEKALKKMGANALLGVGQGSEFESRLVVMSYNGGSKKDAPLAFVGKGVCFDSGGISIKPAGGMEEMKWDMGGAGTVIGLMHALAARKAKVNVVGVVGLVENMPSGTAQRPGDVVTSMSGQTIEVLNTDAEGRLVLADALWYTQDRFKPELIVDLATLTGAIIVALGSSRAGLFSNNDQLADRLAASGTEEGELLWRLPLAEVYDKQINSEIADMQNIGKEREAGSITAAQFLQRFVNNVPWAHLDIAGTAWSKKGNDTTPKGGTGFGVRLLNRFVADHYEK